MEKAIFHGDIAQMMNTDSNWPSTGNRFFTTTEMEIFIQHLWEYVNEKMSGSIDELALINALLKTARVVSVQDRARAILTKLKT